MRKELELFHYWVWADGGGIRLSQTLGPRRKGGWNYWLLKQTTKTPKQPVDFMFRPTTQDDKEEPREHTRKRAIEDDIYHMQ